MLLTWIAVFIASLFVMVKGADWLLASSERIGIVLGFSPFIVGVVIVGLGTSFPELVSAFFAVWQGATEIVVANAVGSNITNILLIVGISALAAGRLVVKKNLIDLDIPLLSISTLLLVGVAWDGQVTIPESILLVANFAIYLSYALIYRGDKDADVRASGLIKLPTHQKHRSGSKIATKDLLLLIIGIAGLVLGAKYLIDSVINLAEILAIGTGVISLTAVALGTSLPELLVSVKAALKNKSEVALGNIFGSNVFNLLIVIGIPGLFGTLTVDSQTISFGLPTLLAATFLFILAGISRRVYIWEGAMYVMVYIFFIGKLFAFL